MNACNKKNSKQRTYNSDILGGEHLVELLKGQRKMVELIEK